MDKNQSLRLASAVFGLIGLVQLLRALLGWKAYINNFEVPVWLSFIAAAVLGYLSWHMWSAVKK